LVALLGVCGLVVIFLAVNVHYLLKAEALAQTLAKIKPWAGTAA